MVGWKIAEHHAVLFAEGNEKHAWQISIEGMEGIQHFHLWPTPQIVNVHRPAPKIVAPRFPALVKHTTLFIAPLIDGACWRRELSAASSGNQRAALEVGSGRPVIDRCT